MNDIPKIAAIVIVLIITSFACSLTGQGATPETNQAPSIEATSPPPAVPQEIPSETAANIEPTTALPTAEPTTEPSPTPIVHQMMPSSSIPGDKPQVMYDQESIRNADKREAYGGDEFLVGKYERPFDQDMKYIPYIDIVEANMVRNKEDPYIYAIIRLQEDPAQKPDQEYGFGIEIDEDLDGTGDYLVWTKLPTEKVWSVDGVTVWKDANADIGFLKPMMSEGPVTQDGYELNIFDSGKGNDADLAWSRVSPVDPKNIEIAFKTSLFKETPLFLWSAWSILGPTQFDRFDHNDYFSYEQAGSPTKKQSDFYPLKEMYALDNTCRSASGFTPKGNEPGVCPLPPPEKKEKSCTQYCFNTGSQTVCVDICE